MISWRTVSTNSAAGDEDFNRPARKTGNLHRAGVATNWRSACLIRAASGS